jgi:stress response protein SCP2
MYFIKMDIDDICITLKKSTDKFDDDDQMDFFKKIIKNQKVFMTMGDKENKLFYVSYQELKTDVEWLCEHVF